MKLWAIIGVFWGMGVTGCTNEFKFERGPKDTKIEQKGELKGHRERDSEREGVTGQNKEDD